MQTTSLVITLCFLVLYLQNHTTVWLSYFVFQEQIAMYCENKSNVACSGKCQVRKIEANTSDERLLKVSIPEILEFLIMKSSISFLRFHRLQTYPTFVVPSLLQGIVCPVFRPPTYA